MGSRRQTLTNRRSIVRSDHEPLGLTQNYETNQSGAPATNRVIGDSSGASFGYDQAGNMTSAPGWTYGYDGANRLSTATGPGGASG